MYKTPNKNIILLSLVLTNLQVFISMTHIKMNLGTIKRPYLYFSQFYFKKYVNRGYFNFSIFNLISLGLFTPALGIFKKLAYFWSDK